MVVRQASVSEQLRLAIVAAAGAGVSRYRIAKETGVSQAALSRFANKLQDIDLASVDKLCAFFDLSLVRRPERKR